MLLRSSSLALACLLLACDGDPKRGDAQTDGSVPRFDASSGPDASPTHDANPSTVVDAQPSRDGSADSAPVSHASMCNPVTQTLTYEQAERCTNDPFLESRVPNLVNAAVTRFELARALTPNVRAAVVVNIELPDARMAVELWGAKAECGAVEELLWTSKSTGKTLCAEFVPSQAFTRLVAVFRRLDEFSGSFSVWPSELSLCASDSCAETPDGEGRSASLTPRPLIGFYKITGGGALPGYDWHVGAWGRMVLARDSSSSNLPTITQQLASGIFRMPPHDPYGDAWYCVGEGSTVVHNRESKTYTVDLNNITRLPSCSKGTDSASISDLPKTFVSDVTGTLSPFNGTQLFTDLFCRSNLCSFSFRNDATSSYSFLQLETDTDPETYSFPPRMTRAVLRADWFYLPQARTPFQRACGASGTVHYDADATTSVSLTNMSGLMTSCPGLPVADNRLTLTLR
jgi:hypothetical protein